LNIRPDSLPYGPLPIPDGKDFAFTIFDDTDGATVENVKPVYDYLHELGMRTTKSVWVFPEKGPDAIAGGGQTLEDPEYLAFIRDLQSKQFEITFHGPRNGSTERPEIRHAMERFREMIGHYPRTHANHAGNRENLYWGADRLDLWPLKLLYALSIRRARNFFSGHIQGSEHFWGDIAQEHIQYIRNFGFRDINTLKANPSMPYHDPRRPYARLWFSCSDGHNVEAFNRLLSKENLDRLERERGVSIVYTHFASGFVSDRALNQTTGKRLRDLASRNGYFAPVNEILDRLGQIQNGTRNLGLRERLAMQVRWSVEKCLYRTP